MRLVRASALDEPDDDRVLVGEAHEGDPAAFRALFDRHAPSVRRFLRDLTRDEGYADEGTQETFVRAHARLGTLREGERVRAWLFGIARRVFLEELRRRRHRAGSEGPEVEPALALASSPEAVLIDAEASRLFRAALERLAPDRRAALLLQLDHGLSYDDIAAVMGFSPARVRNELHRAREELRAFLAPYFEEEA